MKTRIIRVISEIKESPQLLTTISDDSHLMLEVGLNSLDLMRLILELEEEFDIEIDIDRINLDIFKSVNHLSAFIAEMKASNTNQIAS